VEGASIREGEDGMKGQVDGVACVTVLTERYNQFLAMERRHGNSQPRYMTYHALHSNNSWAITRLSYIQIIVQQDLLSVQQFFVHQFCL
jgi:hypothetical protein